jgi:hypothetical protein
MVELACEREDIEVELLLEAIFRFYGFDFRDYERISSKRKIWNVVRLLYESLATFGILGSWKERKSSVHPA